MIEREAKVEWQPGLLLPWAKSQVSFLKDLVTLRNPQSEFSFLNYLYSVGRLDEFINMANFEPYRVEISHYFQWAASSLTKVQLRLNCAATSVEPRYDAGGICGWLTRLADGSEISSRYLVMGIGREPSVPAVLAHLPASRLAHSTRYRTVVAGLDSSFPYRIAIVGSAQSAAEMYRALQDDLPSSQLNWLMRSIGIGAYDKTKFTNELYYPSFVDDFFAASPAARQQLLREMRHTNYSGIEPPFVDDLYCETYLDRLTKQTRKRIVTMTDIRAAEATDEELTLELSDRMTGSSTELRVDLIFLGTGFAGEMPSLICRLGDALGLSKVQVSRQYRLIIDSPSTAACYLQGVNEATHGIADTLLSVIACRAGEIVTDIMDHRARSGTAPLAANSDPIQ